MPFQAVEFKSFRREGKIMSKYGAKIFTGETIAEAEKLIKQLFHLWLLE